MKNLKNKKLAVLFIITVAMFSCEDDSISPEKLKPRGTFTASATSIKEGDEVKFADNSTNTPTAWLWEMPGATPGTSTEQNPTVVYNTEGVYNVTLTITNEHGADTVFLENYIEVALGVAPSLLILLNFEGNLTNEGSEVDPTTTGTPVYGTRTDGGETYVFNGTDNPLKMEGYTGVNGSNPRTIALWIKPESTGYDSGIMSWGFSATGSRWSFKYLPGSGGIRIEWQGGGMNSTLGGLDDGLWHHVALTFDGVDAVTLYIDGAVDATTTTTIIDTGSAGEEDVEIGSYRGDFYYKGEFDDVGLYDMALTLEEINTLKDL